MAVQGTTGFLADSMLGKLARWLRLMGFSVEYAASNKSDNEVIELCRKTKLFLLTRDKELYSRYKPSMYFSSDNHLEQLSAFLSVIKPEKELYFTRCPLCNGRTEKRDTGSYNGVLPEGVKNHFTSIYVCSKCGKVYWEGSHFDSILKTINCLVPGRK